MRIPKIFVPEKNLDDKIEWLLKEQRLPRPKKRNNRLYKELKREFPNFIDYLINLYPDLKIILVKSQSGYTWRFYQNQLYRPPKEIGSASVYIKTCRKDLLEYGNEAQILIKRKWRNLKYRKGYYELDSTKNEIVNEIKDAFRYDRVEDIPFP